MESFTPFFLLLKNPWHSSMFDNTKNEFKKEKCFTWLYSNERREGGKKKMIMFPLFSVCNAITTVDRSVAEKTERCRALTSQIDQDNFPTFVPNCPSSLHEVSMAWDGNFWVQHFVWLCTGGLHHFADQTKKKRRLHGHNRQDTCVHMQCSHCLQKLF